jgi:hypothetical protein
VTPPDPGPVLALWAAGIAAGGSLVGWWRTARPGFFILAAGSAALLGFGAAAAGGGIRGWLASGLALAAAPLRGRRLTAAPLAMAALVWLAIAAQPHGWLPAIAGTLALGGVSSEMLLGHWYLVDPKLPRWALQRLALGGLAGLGMEVVVVTSRLTSGAGIPPAAVWALVGTSLLLMVGVWFSLRVPSYTGVMAATGLSYLAILTTLGGVVAGRALLGG